MSEVVPSPYLVPFDGAFSAVDAPTAPDDPPGKRALKLRLENAVDSLRDLQRRLYAEDRRALLLVFQGLDAAGKDGTIRHVLGGVNPAGCQVFNFREPSAEELDHDFLWRLAARVPERGRIGVFNRSHYEEVLVVRVHPALLAAQKLPPGATDDLEALWERRFAAIRSFERHLAESGTTILKFWLNQSRETQRQRFLDRIDHPDKHWKFCTGDVRERERWDDYLAAYQAALAATSRPWAPWYAIPADNKRYARATVARLIVDTLRAMNPRVPVGGPSRAAELADMRALLEAQAPPPTDLAEARRKAEAGAAAPHPRSEVMVERRAPKDSDKSKKRKQR